MADIEPQSPTPAPDVPLSETPVVPSQKNRNRNLVLIIGGVLLVLCICVGLCLVLGGATVITVYKEKAPIGEVIDKFMQAMVERDTKNALTLFSTRAQRQIKASNLETMLEGSNYVLFDGYQRIEIGNLNVSKAFNTNQDLPQGTVAKVNGTVYYDGGFTGRFDAILEKEAEAWRLHSINITVPPNKLTP